MMLVDSNHYLDCECPDAIITLFTPIIYFCSFLSLESQFWSVPFDMSSLGVCATFLLNIKGTPPAICTNPDNFANYCSFALHLAVGVD